MTTPYTSLSPQQLDGVQFSDDKNFALQGKIMLLVLVSIFSLFILLILMLPCLKKHVRRSHELERDGDSMVGQKIPYYWFIKRRKEDVTPDTNSPCNTGKFPF